MNILIVNNGIIPALKYGGTERVIWDLGRELSKMGHQIYFLVKKGSFCDFAKVIEINPLLTIESQIPEYIDVVHFNTYTPTLYTKPYIVTIHGNDIGENPSLNSVFVSKNHAERFGSSSYAHNGLDWNNYKKTDLDKPRTFYHFLGKAAWRVKNIKGAIDITNAINGAKLEVLGGNRLNIKMGLRFTFSPKINFHGMINDSKKQEILERSKGLIFPVTWHEPFGLAIIESLYMGTPIFGTPYGALPELVTKEVGFLSCKKSEIIAHLKEGNEYNPHLCNEYAQDMFNSHRMAKQYLKKYEIVLEGKTLSSVAPKNNGEKSSKLPWC